MAYQYSYYHHAPHSNAQVYPSTQSILFGLTISMLYTEVILFEPDMVTVKGLLWIEMSTLGVQTTTFNYRYQHSLGINPIYLIHIHMCLAMLFTAKVQR